MLLRPPCSLDSYFDDDRIFVNMFSYLCIFFLSTFIVYLLICDQLKIYIVYIS